MINISKIIPELGIFDKLLILHCTSFHDPSTDFQKQFQVSYADLMKFLKVRGIIHMNSDHERDLEVLGFCGLKIPNELHFFNMRAVYECLICDYALVKDKTVFDDHDPAHDTVIQQHLETIIDLIEMTYGDQIPNTFYHIRFISKDDNHRTVRVVPYIRHDVLALKIENVEGSHVIAKELIIYC